MVDVDVVVGCVGGYVIIGVGVGSDDMCVDVDAGVVVVSICGVCVVGCAVDVRGVAVGGCVDVVVVAVVVGCCGDGVAVVVGVGIVRWC